MNYKYFKAITTSDEVVSVLFFNTGQGDSFYYNNKGVKVEDDVYVIRHVFQEPDKNGFMPNILEPITKDEAEELIELMKA